MELGIVALGLAVGCHEATTIDVSRAPTPEPAAPSSKPVDGAPPTATPAVPAGMIRVEGGMVGRSALATFDIDRHEVTVTAYAECVDAGACRLPQCDGERLCERPGTDCLEPSLCAGYYTWGDPDKREHPIVGIDFQDATAYCRWRGARLITAREWQWASRGRDEARTYPWGEERPAPESGHACWHRTGLGTCPAASSFRDVSRDGVIGLAGNVAEWTTFTGARWGLIGDRPDQHLVVGAGWGTLQVEPMQSTHSLAMVDDYEGDDLGIRCARTVEGP